MFNQLRVSKEPSVHQKSHADISDISMNLDDTVDKMVPMNNKPFDFRRDSSGL